MFALLFLVMTISLVAAEGYEQGKVSDVIFSHDKYPGCATVACQVTIFYPNGTLLIDHADITANVGYSNYTLTASQTQTTGTYPFVLNQNTINPIAYSDNFDITPTGTIPSLGSSMLAGFAIALTLIIGIVFIFLGNSIINNNARYWFFGILAIGIGLLLFYFDVIQIFILLRDVAYTTHTAHGFEKLLPKIATIQKVLAWTFLLFFIAWVVRIFQKISKARSNNDGWNQGQY